MSYLLQQSSECVDRVCCTGWYCIQCGNIKEEVGSPSHTQSCQSGIYKLLLTYLPVISPA